MLMPKRVKHRRVQRGRLKGKALRGNKITHGSFGLVALEPAWVTANQIEAARIAMTRYVKRGGQVWIKIFPDKPIPLEKEMATHSSILTWRISWTEEPGGLQPMGSQRVGHD